MTRNSIHFLRPVVVWLAVTGGTATACGSVPAAWSAARTGAGADAVVDLVVAACTTALALALASLWVVTTATVVDLLRGRVPTSGTTRRLVLIACGVAIAAGTSAPAVAAGNGDGRELLAGLSLPERAVAPLVHHRAAPRTTSTAPARTYVVRPGDSLSSIALAHPGPGSLEERWRAIWLANREVVGHDPDLILPGQALRLPDAHRTQQDGDRR